MPLAAAIKSMAFGELGGAITSGAGSLSLVTGEGTRFPALASGEYIYLMVIDQNETIFDRFEIMLSSAFSADTFSGLVRGLQGTTAKNFPITSGNNPANVKVMIAHNIRQLRELIHGQGAIIQATAPTLTADSPEEIILTPVADITVPLPTGTVASGNPVWAGRRFRFTNNAAPTNPGGPYVLVNASGGGALPPVPPGSVHEYRALQDAPTTPAHWYCERQYVLERGASYESGTGIVGTDATAMTLLTSVIKGNTLRSLGQKLRLRWFALPSTNTSITLAVVLNGVTLHSWSIFNGGTGRIWGIPLMDVSYVDATRANVQPVNAYSLGNSVSVVENVVANLAGLNWAADQNLTITQSNAVGTHITLYELSVQPVH